MYNISALYVRLETSQRAICGDEGERSECSFPPSLAFYNIIVEMKEFLDPFLDGSHLKTPQHAISIQRANFTLLPKS